MASPSVDIARGITVVFATSGFNAEIVDIGSWDWSRDTVDVTHQGSTNALDFVGVDLYDPGELTITCHHNADLDVPSYGGAVETVTVTLPAGATWAASGVITNYSWTGTLNDKMVADVTVKFSGDITVTAA